MKDNNNSQEIKNMEAQASAVVTMTTEEFHKELEASTECINAERLSYAKRLEEIKDEYAKQGELARQQEMEVQNERAQLRATIAARQLELNEKERKIREFRRSSYAAYTEARVQAKNDHAKTNLMLQNSRDSLFAAYRNSGGANPVRRRAAASRESDERKII